MDVAVFYVTDFGVKMCPYDVKMIKNCAQ